MLVGANAAVVGLLGVSAITDSKRFVIALVAFAGLLPAKMPPWLVGACVCAGRKDILGLREL